jgi:hypothetical protein
MLPFNGADVQFPEREPVPAPQNSVALLSVMLCCT